MQEPSLGSVYKGHKGAIASLAFHRDFVVSGGVDKTVIVWRGQPGCNLDASTPGTNAYKLVGHSAAVSCVAVSPTGSLVASVSHDGQLRLWAPTVRGDRQSYFVRAHTGRVFGVAWSPDGSKLVTCGQDKVVKVWHVPSLRFAGSMAQHQGHTNWVRAVAWSGDSHIIVSGGDDGQVILWNADTRQALKRFNLSIGESARERATEHVNALALSSDGVKLAELRGKSVRVWNLHTGELMQCYSSFPEPVLSVAFHPSGTALLVGVADRSVHFIDLARARETYILDGHGGPVTAVAFARDGLRFGTADDQGTLFVWNCPSSMVQPPQPSLNPKRMVPRPPSGRHILSPRERTPQRPLTALSKSEIRDTEPESARCPVPAPRPPERVEPAVTVQEQEHADTTEVLVEQLSAMTEQLNALQRSVSLLLQCNSAFSERFDAISTRVKLLEQECSQEQIVFTAPSEREASIIDAPVETETLDPATFVRIAPAGTAAPARPTFITLEEPKP